ncbi:MAG: roadblock/LC7 domain-containing protein [Promethearchaeota archaeon]
MATQENGNIDQLISILRDMQANNGEITAGSIVSVQGLPIASQLPRESNEGIVSAMAAALLSVSMRACEELGRGIMKRLIVEGDMGFFICQYAGEHAILTILSSGDAKLGMLYLDMEKACKEIAKVLG